MLHYFFENDDDIIIFVTFFRQGFVMRPVIGREVWAGPTMTNQMQCLILPTGDSLAQ